MSIKRRNWRWQEVEKASIPLERLIETFLIHKTSEGKSHRTIQWYAQSLRFFLGFLESQGRSDQLGEVGEQEAREFILHLQKKKKWDNDPHFPSQDKKLSPHTIQTYVRALRSFFSWLWQEGYTEEHRLQGLKPPKVPKMLVQNLTEEELKRILASIDVSTSVGARNYAIVLTLLDTGVRCSELLNL